MAMRASYRPAVQATNMLVVEAAACADEYLVQGPLATIVHRGGGAHSARSYAAAAAARRRCFSAWALAASRTQAPSAWAWRRAVSRSTLHGPLPFNTRSNSLQSIGPNSYRCLALRDPAQLRDRRNGEARGIRPAAPREIDEFLPQRFVVREALDFPALRIAAVRRIGVRRPQTTS